VQIISSNEPLLFVHGPPVFIRVVVTDEESTSVFTPIMEEELERLDEIELGLDKIAQEVITSVTRRIAYLGGAFQKEVYRPLEFDLGEETIIGALGKVEGNTVFIELSGEEESVVAIELSTIKEIFWRGKPFTEE